MAEQFGTVDDYIRGFPEDVQAILEEIRRRFGTVVPGVGEKLSYQMPTVTMDGTALVYYAAWKNHIGMYPIPPADAALEQQIAPYRAAKDTVRFPYKKGVPFQLIEQLAEMLVRRRLDSENDPHHDD